MKKGISLIVLVITIIVMIILAATVIISLTNTNIINRADQAVQLTNAKQVQDLVALAWADAYAGGERDIVKLQEAVDKVVEESKIDTNRFEITVTTGGVTVVDKNEQTKPEDTTPEPVVLTAPTVAVSNNTLTITDTNAKVDRYIIYVNGVEKTTTTVKTFALDELDLTTGTYKITVKATASGFEDSQASAEATYSVISFVIGTTTYYTRTGSTWTEWVNSKYNKAEATTSGTNLYVGSAYVTTSGSTAVDATATINAGATYSLYTPSSSGDSDLHGGGSN